MEDLSACYASSSEDDDGEEETETEVEVDAIQAVSRQCSAPSSPASAQQTADAPPAAARSSEQTAALRAALAQRFRSRARAATHRTTAEERDYAYRPYHSRRAGQSGHPAELGNPRKTQARPPPLFSKFRALSSPIDVSHTRGVDGDAAPPSQAPCILSKQTHVAMEGHSGAVTCLDWNPLYPPLFSSSSMDGTVRVWSLPRECYEDGPSTEYVDAVERCHRVLTHHLSGVKSAKWSIDGRHLWTGGYDGQAAYVDVETASVVQRNAHHTNEHVTSIAPHPLDPQLALIGTDRGRVHLRDLRLDASAAPSVVYGTKTTGEIHDLLFLPTEHSNDMRFVSSSALTARDTSHQTLLVWDLRSGSLLADHLNNDLCSFTALRLHPNHRHFAAQSTSSEIVLFSASAPHKRFKPTRSYNAGHDVQGFSVGISFNASGALLASGDVHGRVVVYDTHTRRVVKQLHAYDAATPCVAVAFHPQWPATLLSGGYDGRLELFDSRTSVLSAS